MPYPQTESGPRGPVRVRRVHMAKKARAADRPEAGHDGFSKDAVDPRDPYRWVMLGLLWLLYGCFGMVSRSSSPLVTPMLRDLSMTYGQMGFVLGSWQLTYIAVAVVAGIVIDRWGMRRSLFVGTVFVGLSAALRFFADGFAALLLMVALFGVGGPMISIGAPKTISLWFVGKDRGLAVGIYTTGPWIGGMIALAATNSIVMPLVGYSWRLAFVCYGSATFAAALLWWILSRETVSGKGRESFGLSAVVPRMVRVRNVRIVLVAGLLSFAVIHGFNNWLPKILEAGGMSPIGAGYAASFPSLSGIPAVLLIPRLVPSVFRGRFIAFSSLLAAAAVFWVTAGAPAPLAGMLLFGIAAASLFPLLVLILMDTPEVGAANMGVAGGVFFCVAEIGGFLGPALMGVLVDWTGTFMAGAFFLGGLSLAVCCMTFLLEDVEADCQTLP